MDKSNFPYEKLVLNDMKGQLPGLELAKVEPLYDTEIRQLIGQASKLSFSDDPADKSLCFEVIVRLLGLTEARDFGVHHAADALLSRLGNFPGRTLLRDRFTDDAKHIPSTIISLEKIAREAENLVAESNESCVLLTDFQYSLYRAATTGAAVSVSAPTSAGKSFVLNLSIQNRLSGIEKESIIYIVPTRALITEVAQRIRKHLKKVNLFGISIRTAPFPVKIENVEKGVIYILTQERLCSLLYSSEPGLWITALIIDEAHEIQKNKRGIVLQNGIDAAIKKFQQFAILFASPLIGNPEYFHRLFGTGPNGVTILEKTSPVAQNIILVEKIKGKPKNANFYLLTTSDRISLGSRQLGFKLEKSKSKCKALLAISITKNRDSTIIFANNSADAEAIAEHISNNLLEDCVDDDLEAFIDFIKAELHPEYPLATYLKKGVGYHYGYMPSIIRNGVESLFREKKIKYLCCTSTLLQGVNLPAKNIIINDPRTGDTPMTRSDFLNLCGRAGRLTEEFHGNIWCINPNEWESQAYISARLENICSAFDITMRDGGTAITKLLENHIGDENERENAEIAFSRIFHEIASEGRDCVIGKYKTVENEISLENSINLCEKISVSIPPTILEMHKSLRPDQLDSLFKKLHSEIFLGDLLPLPPYRAGAKQRFENILNIICMCFEWKLHENYIPLLSYIAYEWVKGTGIGVIVSNRVSYIRNKNASEKASKIIRDILKIIERDIRFKLEKYFSAYCDILQYLVDERKLDSASYRVEPYHVYLEFGASNKLSLCLMALGLSRFTALKLSKLPSLIAISSDNPEDYLKVLSSMKFQEDKL